METKQKKTKIVVSVLALAAVLVFSLFAMAGSLEPSAPPGPTMKTLDEVEPAMPISSVPYTIVDSGSYYLTSTLQSASSMFSGVTIWADNVTLDLKGFALIGEGSAGPHGVFVEGEYRNIKICNGTVRNWGGNGVDAASAANSRLENLRASDNRAAGLRLGEGGTVSACSAYDNTNNGIEVGSSCTITDCTARSNGGAGFSIAGGSTITNCSAADNTGTGILCLDYACTVTSCTAAANTTSGVIVPNGSTVTGSSARSNHGYGIDADDACTLTGNTASQNYDIGIRTGQGCTLTANTAYDNNDTGIQAGTNSTVTANTSCHNNGAGSDGISTAGSCRLTNNTACYNDGDGINFTSFCTVIGNTCDHNGYLTADGAGIHATGNRNRIEANNVTDNDRGIDVDGFNNLIIKNTAAGNPNEYVIAGGNDTGTISTNPTTAGPWDNFDF